MAKGNLNMDTPKITSYHLIRTVEQIFFEICYLSRVFQTADGQSLPKLMDSLQMCLPSVNKSKIERKHHGFYFIF